MKLEKKIADFISYLQSLKEVSINILKLNKDVYLKIGKAILHNKSIIACKLMNLDKKEVKKGEIDVIYKSIKSIKLPTTAEQRASYNISNKNTILAFDLATAINAKEAKFENEEEDKVE